MSLKPLSITAGVDVGTSAAKAAIVGHFVTGPQVLGTWRERILRRDAAEVAGLAFVSALEAAGFDRTQVGYVASTGEADELKFHDGHFYGMTTHARGATFLDPRTSCVVDIGALHARVMVIDTQSRVVRSKMTSQCAAGTGQFLENIARYLGIRSDEVGPLSLRAQRAEPCSGICAVLSETDVINMVSRGVPAGEILRGVHDSIAQRLARLLRSAEASGVVMLTGGLANDTGLSGALTRQLGADHGAPLEVVAHPLSVFAGALGAALWGEHRRQKLEAPERLSA